MKTAAMVIGKVVMLGAGSAFALRHLRRAPEEQALRRMARRMGLQRVHVELVRKLAAAIGAAPVALLVSETAFERALAGASAGLIDADSRRVALELRSRAFGGSTAAEPRGRKGR